MTRSSYAAVLAAALFLAWLPRAHADEKLEAAKAKFESGGEKFTAKDYRGAAADFDAAYALKPFAAFLFNEAVCYEKLKDYSRAVSLFQQYVASTPKPRDASDVQDRIKNLMAFQNPPPKGQRPSPPVVKEVGTKGVVLVDTKPIDADIYIDDKALGSVGTSPWSGALDGKHTIIAEAKGYETDKEVITGNPNKIIEVHITMTKEVTKGWLEVNCNIPGASVYIDKKDIGAVGLTPFRQNVLKGKHTIYVTREGFTEETKQVDIVAGEDKIIEAHLEKAPIGFVRVSGGSEIEGAQVKLDGAVVCETAPCRFQSPEGEHTVTVSKPGRKDLNKKLSIGSATQTELSVRLAEKQGHLDVIWNFGFAGAFLIGGIVLGLQANSVYDEIQSDINKGMPPIAPDDSRFLKGKLFSYGADALFLIGTVTAATGVISLLKEKGPPSIGLSETRDLSWSPAIGPDYAGIQAGVRW